MTAASPSWDLSRNVRASIICKNQKVNTRTASRALINEIAANMIGNGHHYIVGYDVRTVRAILLDKSVTAPYPPAAPAAYAGK